MEPILNVKNLTIEYENENSTIIANRAVSLELYSNEITGIIGYNASGKTTLLKACMGLLLKDSKITSGEITFEGKDITERSDINFYEYQDSMKDIRGKDIAMIFQNPSSYFDPTMKISKQIYEALNSHSKVSFLDRKTKAIELLEKFHVQDPKKVLNKYPIELSGGTLQKIQIAMALFNKPKVLLADEPFSALDEISTQEMIEIFKEYHNEYGMSILIILHDLNILKELCENGYFMKDGVLSECYSIENMFDTSNTDIQEYIEMRG